MAENLQPVRRLPSIEEEAFDIARAEAELECRKKLLDICRREAAYLRRKHPLRHSAFADVMQRELAEGAKRI